MPSIRSSLQTKRSLTHAFNTIFDDALGISVNQAKTVPVRINYSMGSKRFDKEPDAVDLALCALIDRLPISTSYPTGRLMEGQETRRNDPSGLTHVHHFYTRRNLAIFSYAFRSFREI